MARFVGSSGKRIQFVSTDPVKGSNIFEVPASLDHLGNSDLMHLARIRDGRVVESRAVFNNPSDLRVACIAVHKIRCGIATYSDWLWEAMRPMVKDLHVFAEEHSDAAEAPGVSHCWKRGQPLSKLLEAVRAYDPDVVYIQHEYGIFPDARYWLSLLSGLHEFRTVVALHSVYAHKDKTIVEAACSEIIVHSNRAAKELKETKKVPGKVHVIPHGTFPTQHGKHWNLYRTPHTLIQFGFGFRYKAYETALEAVAILKADYPGIFFTGIFSESAQGRGEMDAYYRDLQERVRALGIEDNVAIIRGFQSDESLDAYIRTNRVALFPYKDNGEHTVFACSGAALLAMSKGVPVIASHVPLFDSLDGVCARPATAQELVTEIRALFDDAAMQAQVERQDRYLEENRWANAARRYLGVLL